MRNTWIIFKRELVGYFITPIAYVFIVIFLFLAGLLTFSIGGFYERGEASLSVFFNFHPWLYLFLIPAISMRLWAEERRTGTIEVLMTLPVTPTQAVLGKFFAAWAFTSTALLLTFPLWITVAYLGEPDNGVIIASYVASFLMAGAYLAIGACISAATKNQVIAFVISVLVCFLLIVAGLPMVANFLGAVHAPRFLTEAITSFSFLSRFNGITRGVLSARDVIFFVSMIAGWLFVNVVVINVTKSK